MKFEKPWTNNKSIVKTKFSYFRSWGRTGLSLSLPFLIVGTGGIFPTVSGLLWFLYSAKSEVILNYNLLLEEITFAIRTRDENAWKKAQRFAPKRKQIYVSRKKLTKILY